MKGQSRRVIVEYVPQPAPPKQVPEAPDADEDRRPEPVQPIVRK